MGKREPTLSKTRLDLSEGDLQILHHLPRLPRGAHAPQGTSRSASAPARGGPARPRSIAAQARETAQLLMLSARATRGAPRRPPPLPPGRSLGRERAPRGEGRGQRGDAGSQESTPADKPGRATASAETCNTPAKRPADNRLAGKHRNQRLLTVAAACQLTWIP